MKKINLLVGLVLAFGTFTARANERVQKLNSDLFAPENVECVFRYKTEASSDIEVPMTKGTLNGMVGTLTAYFAAFEKDGVSYLVTASSPMKYGNIMVIGAEVTITNTKKGQYGDGMIKGALTLSESHAYGFIGMTESKQKEKQFVSSSLGVVCSIPKLLEQQ